MRRLVPDLGWTPLSCGRTVDAWRLILLRVYILRFGGRALIGHACRLATISKQVQARLDVVVRWIKVVCALVCV